MNELLIGGMKFVVRQCFCERRIRLTELNSKEYPATVGIVESVSL